MGTVVLWVASVVQEIFEIETTDPEIVVAVVVVVLVQIAVAADYQIAVVIGKPIAVAAVVAQIVAAVDFGGQTVVATLEKIVVFVEQIFAEIVEQIVVVAVVWVQTALAEQTVGAVL